MTLFLRNYIASRDDEDFNRALGEIERRFRSEKRKLRGDVDEVVSQQIKLEKLRDQELDELYAIKAAHRTSVRTGCTFEQALAARQLEKVQ